MAIFAGVGSVAAVYVSPGTQVVAWMLDSWVDPGTVGHLLSCDV